MKYILKWFESLLKFEQITRNDDDSTIFRNTGNCNSKLIYINNFKCKIDQN